MKIKIGRSLIVLSLAFVVLACQGFAPLLRTPVANVTPGPAPTSAKQGPPDSPVMQDRHRRIFRSICSIVKQYYVYEDFNGVDWDALKAEYASLVESATSDDEFWFLMMGMIYRLNDDHSSFLTPAQVAEETAMMEGAMDYVGVGVLTSVPEGADYAVVLFPLPGSPAEEAGIMAHDRIISLGGESVCCNDNGADNLDLLLGKVGTSISVTVQQPDGELRELKLQREIIQGQFPIISERITTDSGDVGYLMIPTLFDETIGARTREKIEALLADGPLLGLVIDMRINGGGAYTELYDLLSLFTSGEAGQFFQRGSKPHILEIEADPIANTQDLPLAILIGEASASYAEIFSGVLQSLDRATLVGQPTSGNVETIYPYDLEDGSRLWLAREVFLSVNDDNWEGVGVQPDVFVDGSWEDFSLAYDPQLDKAVDMIVDAQ